MTAEQYIAKGFNFSQHIEQAKIDRAEADVTAAYITPIVGAGTGADVDDAVANLAFLLLMQRSLFETRVGAKVKLTQNSQTPYAWDALSQQAHVCDLKIVALRKRADANKTACVDDICKIYFTSNYFYTL